MAKIYGGVQGLEVPKFNWENIEAYRKACEKYVSDLRESLKGQNTTGKNVGEIIRFPVADGTAEYMVASMRPLELVHIGIGDGYQYPDVALYKAKDVQAKIDQQKKLDQFFAERQK